MPIAGVESFEENLRRTLLKKRIIDLVICILLLPILVILAVLCALAIKLESSGPVIFTQERTGRHGRRFRMYKFRTMVHDAEQLKESLAHLNILSAPDFKIIDDPRVTRVGKVLRETSLDELPQILNVLRGEMSLVGPRPTSFTPTTYSLWHTQRLEVPPGLTGLWQITGRNATSFDERLRLDIQYIRGMCVTLDLKIIFRTAAAVFRRSGA